MTNVNFLNMTENIMFVVVDRNVSHCSIYRQSPVKNQPINLRVEGLYDKRGENRLYMYTHFFGQIHPYFGQV